MYCFLGHRLMPSSNASVCVRQKLGTSRFNHASHLCHSLPLLKIEASFSVFSLTLNPILYLTHLPLDISTNPFLRSRGCLFPPSPLTICAQERQSSCFSQPIPDHCFYSNLKTGPLRLILNLSVWLINLGFFPFIG